MVSIATKKGVDKNTVFLKGFTLIELIMSLFLSSVLMLTVSELYSSIKKLYQSQVALLEIEENATFAIFYLNKVLRMAGDKHCLKNKNIVSPALGSNNEDTLVISHCHHKNNNDIFERTFYFVGDTHRKTASGEKILSLFEKDESGIRWELVEGVQKMLINYGEMCPDGKNICRYLKANQVQDWKKIKSITLSFLFHNDHHKKWYFTYIFLRENNS